MEIGLAWKLLSDYTVMLCATNEIVKLQPSKCTSRRLICLQHTVLIALFLGGKQVSLNIKLQSINSNNFKVSEIIHKAYIEVDEEGTTAAAATGIQFYESDDSRPPQPFVTFYADHPFVFIIYHKPTDNILFVGRVDNPLQ